ncbi:MAG TPA: hypothetical protein VGS57_00065 [Thermoanaerobaculia bacterium]|jgi:Spy/CpxP family protein refolding chaperone|nr:hypothetical protein [Thermoanaerobaculia bacterium]
MFLVRSSMNATAAFLIALMLQLVSFPTAAAAQWHPNVPDRKSDHQVVTYVVVAGLATGVLIAWQKYNKKRRERPTLDSTADGGASADAFGDIATGKMVRARDKAKLHKLFSGLGEPRLMLGWDPQQKCSHVGVRWSF